MLGLEGLLPDGAMVIVVASKEVKQRFVQVGEVGLQDD